MSTKAKVHRRRTEDEMRRALNGLATRMTPQRDDDWQEALEDAINELMALRHIVVQTSQDFGAINTFLTNSMKQL